jgi:hypothetical protein
MNEQPELRTSRRAFLATGAAAGVLSLGAARLLIDTPAAFAGASLPEGVSLPTCRGPVTGSL